jgi:hypothetical protein
MSPLHEFPQQVIASHALVVAEILAGEQPDTETFIHLRAEILSIAKLTTLQCRGVLTIRETRRCWQRALECFMQSEELWSRLSHDGELFKEHWRLLRRSGERPNELPPTQS